MYINHFVDFEPYKLPRSLCTHWSQYAERNNVLDDWIEQWPSQETLNHEGIGERTYKLVNRDQSNFSLQLNSEKNSIKCDAKQL